MLIEFSGPPGSGKSTLARAAIRFFRKEEIEAVSSQDFSFILRSRSMAGRLVGLAPALLQERLFDRVSRITAAVEWRNFTRSHSHLVDFVRMTQLHRPATAGVSERKVITSFQRMVISLAIINRYRRPGEIVICDEGFLHRVIALFVSPYETLDPKLILEYLQLVPRPDCLVSVQVSPQISQSRAVQRGLISYLQAQPGDCLNRFFLNAQAVLDVAIDHARRENWPVCEIDNSADDPSLAIENLRQSLFQYQAVSTR